LDIAVSYFWFAYLTGSVLIKIKIYFTSVRGYGVLRCLLKFYPSLTTSRVFVIVWSVLPEVSDTNSPRVLYNSDKYVFAASFMTCIPYNLVPSILGDISPLLFCVTSTGQKIRFSILFLASPKISGHTSWLFTLSKYTIGKLLRNL